MAGDSDNGNGNNNGSGNDNSGATDSSASSDGNESAGETGNVGADESDETDSFDSAEETDDPAEEPTPLQDYANFKLGIKSPTPTTPQPAPAKQESFFDKMKGFAKDALEGYVSMSPLGMAMRGFDAFSNFGRNRDRSMDQATLGAEPFTGHGRGMSEMSGMPDPAGMRLTQPSGIGSSGWPLASSLTPFQPSAFPQANALLQPTTFQQPKEEGIATIGLPPK